MGAFTDPQIYLGSFKTFPTVVPPVPVSISVSPSSYSSIAASGSTVVFTVTCNYTGWTCSTSDASVATVTKTSETTATCSVLQNASIDGRSATLTFSYSGTSATATVSQVGAAPYFILTPSSASDVSDRGTSGSFTVTTNVPTWTVYELYDYSWLSISRNGNTVTWTVDENTGVGRNAAIVVSGAGITETFSLSQQGYYFGISFSSRDFGVLGGTATLTIDNPRGYSWSISESAGWLSLSQYSGSGSATITLSVDGNTGAYRETLLTISETTHSQTYQYWISQDAFEFYVQPTSLEYNYTGETKSFVVHDPYNLGWEITSKPLWVNVSTLAGTGDTTVNVYATSYSGVDDRTGKTIVTDSQFQTTAEVSLTQHGHYSFSISPTSMTFGSTGGTQQLDIYDPDSLGWYIEIPLTLQSWIRVTDGYDNDVTDGTGSATLYVKADASGSGNDDIMIFDNTYGYYQLLNIDK